MNVAIVVKIISTSFNNHAATNYVTKEEAQLTYSMMVFGSSGCEQFTQGSARHGKNANRISGLG